MTTEAFAPIVESLLGRPLDSPEFHDACEVAGQAEIDEALRQLRQQLEWPRAHPLVEVTGRVWRGDWS